MKSRDQGGVVDERLNVYGIQNLKIAGRESLSPLVTYLVDGLTRTDLSIFPENVGSNTYNTAIAIGEKAAVIIAQDLGIMGVNEI
jgi:alcohol oxidase